MADIQSATAEIRRGKKKKEIKKKKPQGKNIMVCPISYGDHNQGEEECEDKSTVQIVYVQIGKVNEMESFLQRGVQTSDGERDKEI